MGLIPGKDYTVQNMNIAPENFHAFLPTARINGKTVLKKDTYIYVYEGEFLYSIGSKTYIVQPHQIAFFPKNVPHFRHVTMHENLKAVEGVLSYQFNGEEDLFSFFNLLEDDYVLSIKNYERLEACLHEFLHDPDFTTNVSYQLQRVSKMVEILAIYFENLQIRNKNRETWKQVLTYMQEHMDGDVSLEVLANLLYVHPNYFMRKFKQAFGVSPMKYYNDMRIDKAIQLFANTEMHSSEIAAAIGIEDPNYFSYFFKTATGLSPRKFKGLIRQMHGQSEDALFFS